MIGKFMEQNELGKTLTGLVGVGIYAVGMNLFIVPLGLYSGGLMGISQLIRTFLIQGAGMNFGAFDIAGAIYYLLNIPLAILAYHFMDRIFVRKLIVTVTGMSFFLSIIPVPRQPLLDEALTCCLIGGIICGFGSGIYLRAGCSGGGLEVIFIYLTRRVQDFSVGRMNMVVNAFIYTVCLIVFEPSVAIYSVIYSMLNSLTMDRVHSQNIRVEAIIISKTGNEQIERNILKELRRGITYWPARGGYTGEEADVLYTVLSKYEIGTLRRIVHEANPQAFMVIKEGLSVNGNFVKRL